MAPVVGPALALIKTSPYKQAAWMGAYRLQAGPWDRGRAGVEASLLQGPGEPPPPLRGALTLASNLGIRDPQFACPQVKTPTGCRTTRVGLAASW